MLSAVYKVIPPPENGPAAPTFGDWMEMLQQRDRLIWAWERFGDQWDVLLLPPMPMTAFTHCDLGAPLAVDDEWVPHGRVSHHLFPFNLTGQPAIVLPLSSDRQGLPIGVQVVGRRWADERLLAIAAQLAEVTGPFRRPPGY